ncbi:MAG: hypothetical protein HZC51_09600 [Nitrospirae bacterium]|nr:hypothetical protein [Nitrospirota bacterium]
MIDKTTLIPTVLKRLKQLPVGGCLDLRPYKRNRSVVIRKTGEDYYEITEDGFFKDEMKGDIEKVGKLMRAILKSEFPRSTKLRLYTGKYGE